MRRLIVAFLGLALPGIFLVSSAPAPAGATTECWTEQSGGFWHKNCLITSSRYTGEWEAYVTWTYRLGGIAGIGNVNVTMWDRDNDYCTTVRVRFRGAGNTAGVSETRWRSACNGDTKSFDIALNDQSKPFFPYTEGRYYVDFCQGKRPVNCINKWVVNVANTRP